MLLLRKTFLGDMTNQRSNNMIFDMMYTILETRLFHGCGHTTMNSTNLKMADCRRFFDLCGKFGANITLLNIHPPSIEELIRRNKERFERTGFNIPEHVFQTHTERFYNCFPEFEKYAQEYTSGNFNIVPVNQKGEVWGST